MPREGRAEVLHASENRCNGDTRQDRRPPSASAGTSSALACNAALTAIAPMTAGPIVHVLDQSATPRRTSATAMRANRVAGGTETTSSSARMCMSRSDAPTRPQKRPASCAPSPAPKSEATAITTINNTPSAVLAPADSVPPPAAAGGSCTRARASPATPTTRPPTTSAGKWRPRVHA